MHGDSMMHEVALLHRVAGPRGVIMSCKACWTSAGMHAKFQKGSGWPLARLQWLSQLTCLLLSAQHEPHQLLLASACSVRT